MAAPQIHAGLDGIVAASTRLSNVDGLAGELIIAGFPAEEIAPQASFEEMVFLLWNDRLPNADELDSFSEALTRQRSLAPATLDLLRKAADHNVDPMEALLMGTATLSLSSAESDARYALVAQMPTMVAAYNRMRNGLAPVPPTDELGHAANFLYMLRNEVPDEESTRALDTYLNTVVDHGLNASTFAARVIIATGSDLVSAVTGAIGALKGPLHGGAPGPALDMVFEIGTPERAEPHMRAMLERGERLMGFGHRIYKVRDPRADILATAAVRLFEQGSADPELFALTRHVESVAIRLLEEYKPGRNLQTNVEFYTALLMHGLGFSTETFTPVFAMSRTAGWIAHALEQQAVGRIIRPQSHYTGETTRQWQPLAQRR